MQSDQNCAPGANRGTAGNVSELGENVDSTACRAAPVARASRLVSPRRAVPHLRVFRQRLYHDEYLWSVSLFSAQGSQRIFCFQNRFPVGLGRALLRLSKQLRVPVHGPFVSLWWRARRRNVCSA